MIGDSVPSPTAMLATRPRQAPPRFMGEGALLGAQSNLSQVCFTSSRPGLLEKIQTGHFTSARMAELRERSSTFRYSLSEPDTVVHVNFEFEEQALAFAEAFRGVVLVRWRADQEALNCGAPLVLSSGL